MGRLILLTLMLATLPSCAVLSAAAGAASTVVDSVAYLFQDQTQSLSVSTREALVATQRSLKGMELPAALVEFDSDGYRMKFGNGDLAGSVQLTRRTGRLTSIGVTVYEGTFGRASSVEKAVFDSVRQQLKEVKPGDRFDISDYDKVLRKPKENAEQLGWYLPTSPLKVRSAQVKNGWLRIKMPSGKQGYVANNKLHKGAMK